MRQLKVNAARRVRTAKLEQAMAVLQQSEQQHRAILRTAMDGFWRVDRHGRLLEVNEAYCRMSGYREHELLAMSISDLEDAETPAGTTGHLRKIMAQGAERFESRHRRKDGSTFAVEISVQSKPAEGGQMVAFLRDITERRQVEKALRESQTRYRRLHESMMDAFVSVSLKGWIQESNPAFQKMLGYSGEELKRLTYLNLTPPRWQAIDAKIVAEQILPRGYSDVYEKEFRKKDGTVFPVELRAFLIRAEASRPAVMWAIVRDITERKQAEERLRIFSQEILIARENERKQVSANLHHDVGSLVVGVSAHLDAIVADLRSEKPRQALQWVKRTRKLFDKSVASLKRVAVQLRPPELDVLGLRAALRQHFSQVTKYRGTQIHFRETLGRRRISEDTATILFRIAQETLTNAITHGQATRVDVNLRASKAEVSLTIRNNGKGFDPSEQRVRATSHMGLLVMREMATFVGGTFTIDSERGKETTVRVSLPLVTTVLGTVTGTVREETLALGKMHRAVGRGSRSQKRSGA
ncbi:MAG: PAS domain S-box protein [Verrucomicrobiota bacterium]